MEEDRANARKHMYIGFVHKPVYDESTGLDRKLLLSLYTPPCLVGAATLLLIIVFCVIGLCGIAGVHPVYFGICTTVLGILISVMETFLIIVCIRASMCVKATEHYLQKFCECGNVRNCKCKKNLLKLLHSCDISREATDEFDDLMEDFDTVAHLRQPTRTRGLFLFTGFCLFNFSFVLTFWGLFVIRMEYDPPVWYVYLLVDMLIGVASPVFFVISIYIIGFAGRYITKGELRTEALIPAFLSFVSYIRECENSRYPYWKIADYFQFPIYPESDWGDANFDKDNDKSDPKQSTSFLSGMTQWIHNIVQTHKKSLVNDYTPLFFTPSLNIASWCLSGITSVTFCLSVTYIVGQLLTGEQFVFACSEVKGDDFHCFDHSTKDYVNCSSDDDTKRELDCFRFNQVGVQTDPIGTIITAVFLYLACDKFLSVTFRFVKVFFKVHPSKLWGVGVSSLGLILILLCISCSIIYDQIHSVYFDFQKLLQLYIISINIFLSGILLLTVKYSKRD